MLKKFHPIFTRVSLMAFIGANAINISHACVTVKVTNNSGTELAIEKTQCGHTAEHPLLRSNETFEYSVHPNSPFRIEARKNIWATRNVALVNPSKDMNITCTFEKHNPTPCQCDGSDCPRTD